jgi:hypothetical protein
MRSFGINELWLTLLRTSLIIVTSSSAVCTSTAFVPVLSSLSPYKSWFVGTRHNAKGALYLNNNKDNVQEQGAEDRSQGLRKTLTDIGQVFGNKEEAQQICVGSTVVANSNIADLQIWQFQSYTLQEIWDQGVPRITNTVIIKDNEENKYVDCDNDNTNTINNGLLVEKIPRQCLDDPLTPGYTRYIKLYSTKHHSATGPVTINPNDVVLVSLRDEVFDSIVMALPLFGFWTALALSFATKYMDRNGGTFLDAMLGR